MAGYDVSRNGYGINGGKGEVKMMVPCSYFFPLFDHMSREHGLTLTDSELNEIVRVAESMAEKGNPCPEQAQKEKGDDPHHA